MTSSERVQTEASPTLAPEANGPLPSICFVATSPAIPRALTNSGPEIAGGAEQQLAMLGKHLAQAGWRVTFLVHDYGQEAHVVTDEGIILRRALSKRLVRGPLGRICESLPQMWRSLKAADADVYLMRGAEIYVPLVAYFCRRTSRAFVYHFSKMQDVARVSRPWWTLEGGRAAPFRGAIGRAAMIVAQTVQQQQALEKVFDCRIELVRNPCALGPGASGKSSTPLVVWAGSLRPFKRPELCLAVARRMPEVRFILVGARAPRHGDLADRVEAEAAAIPNLELTGFVRRMFAEAHVLLNTSPMEGFSNAFLEAWSGGTPVVATVDPDDIMNPGKLGL